MIKVDEKAQASKLIRRVAPVYPEPALKARAQGRVRLSVTIDEEGNVSKIDVAQGHPFLDQAAVDAVKRWKYSPTFLNGKPIPVTTTVTVDFNMK